LPAPPPLGVPPDLCSSDGIPRPSILTAPSHRRMVVPSVTFRCGFLLCCVRNSYRKALGLLSALTLTSMAFFGLGCEGEGGTGPDPNAITIVEDESYPITVLRAAQSGGGSTIVMERQHSNTGFGDKDVTLKSPPPPRSISYSRPKMARAEFGNSRFGLLSIRRSAREWPGYPCHASQAV
jgi:hypothetical protein